VRAKLEQAKSPRGPQKTAWEHLRWVHRRHPIIKGLKKHKFLLSDAIKKRKVRNLHATSTLASRMG